MLGRRLASLTPYPHKPFSPRFSTASAAAEAGKVKSLGRTAVSAVLLSLTGGLALSALDDLGIYYGCTSKAMEKANKNQEIINALGEPISRGSWYDASLAVAHKRRTLSCTFPVSGPQGLGKIKLKAVRPEGSTWFSLSRYRDWDILMLEALVTVPEKDVEHRTFRVSLMENYSPAAIPNCTACVPGDSGELKK
ncbi:hypothetical protein QJS04_geneDACA002224 [Acorus gramineus]|uniref:Uncharacterized protein n=1 Tax=Acorus gramineus TaxID=55184 RepID=A0AAV9A9X6_ACOGR|nr:hypothetical protein QJS04_geneDACA002224 [Acorus gramineus]